MALLQSVQLRHTRVKLQRCWVVGGLVVVTDLPIVFVFLVVVHEQYHKDEA